MADTVPTPVAGGGAGKGAPDGVNSDPGKRTAGGESSGGAYPNPHTGKDDKGEGGTGGFMGHGGQSHIDYSGPGDGEDGADNDNAATGAE